jgi:oligosaccharide repeat unit polymerase
VTGPVSFQIGVLIVSSFYLNTRLLTVPEVRARLVGAGRTSIIPRRFFWSIVVLFLAYVAAYAIETVIEGTVPLFSPRPDLLRVSFGVFGLHLIVNAMMGIVLLATEYLLVVPREGGRKGFVVFVILVSVGTYFLLLQRYTLFVVAVIAGAIVYYTSTRIRARTVVPVIVSFIAVLFFINQIRSARYVQEYVYLASKMRFSKDLWMLAEPYMYISMNLENFTRAVDRLDHYYLGYFTFDPLLALVGLKHWLAEYFQIDRLPFLISGYNTFTFHWWYYYDFGVVGVALLPLLTGFVIAHLYYKLRTNPDLLTLMMYSSGVLVIIVSFIMNPLTRLDFISNLFIIWVVHRFLIAKKSPSPISGPSEHP